MNTKMSTHYMAPEEIKKMSQYDCILKLQEIVFEHKQKIPQGDFKTGSDVLKKLYEINSFEAELKNYYVFFRETKSDAKLRFKFKLHPLLVEYLIERCYEMHRDPWTGRYQSNDSIYNHTSFKNFLENWKTPVGEYPSYPHINSQYEETIQNIIDSFKVTGVKLTLLMIREITV